MLTRESIFPADERTPGKNGGHTINHNGIRFRSTELIRISAICMDDYEDVWQEGRFQFVGYHTYDRLVDLVCNMFARARSAVLELHRTETVGDRVLVGRLVIVTSLKSYPERLRYLLINSQHNRKGMSVERLAEVNRELLYLRGDAPCLRVRCGGRLVGFFAPDFETNWTVLDVFEASGSVREVTVRLPPGQSPERWASAQLGCEPDPAVLPTHAIRQLRKAACNDSEAPSRARNAYGEQLNIVVAGKDIGRKCREIRIFERMGRLRRRGR